jgi:hypothetical protein
MNAIDDVRTTPRGPNTMDVQRCQSDPTPQSSRIPGILHQSVRRGTRIFAEGDQALKFHQSPQPAGKGVEIQSKFGFVLPKRQKLTLL